MHSKTARCFNGTAYFLAQSPSDWAKSMVGMGTQYSNELRTRCIQNLLRRFIEKEARIILAAPVC